MVDTSRMFHAASAALNRPARRPMRGSGVGVPMLPIEVVEVVEVVEVAHAAPATSPARKSSRADAAGNDAGFTRDSGHE